MSIEDPEKRCGSWFIGFPAMGQDQKTPHCDQKTRAKITKYSSAQTSFQGNACCHVTSENEPSLLQMSNDPLHQRLRQHLDPSLEFDSPLEASRAVVNTPNLGFIVESVQADTLMKDNCHLTTVGDLGPKFYGIAFPLESSLKRELSEQILKYAEDGTLFSLRSKWLVDMEHACGVKFGPGNFGQQYQTPTPHEAITKDSWDTDGDYLSCGQVGKLELWVCP